jgi:hypothetical protein
VEKQWSREQKLLKLLHKESDCIGLFKAKIVDGLLYDNGNGEELRDAERTLPSWFNSEDIYNHFHGKPIGFNTYS